jgi:hypothetical protein
MVKLDHRQRTTALLAALMAIEEHLTAEDNLIAGQVKLGERGEIEADDFAEIMAEARRGVWLVNQIMLIDASGNLAIDNGELLKTWDEGGDKWETIDGAMAKDPHVQQANWWAGKESE